MSSQVKVINNLEADGRYPSGAGVLVRPGANTVGQWVMLAEEAAAVLFKLRPDFDAERAGERVVFTYDIDGFDEEMRRSAIAAFQARWKALRAAAPVP